jgi:hypothetical protein
LPVYNPACGRWAFSEVGLAAPGAYQPSFDVHRLNLPAVDREPATPDARTEPSLRRRRLELRLAEAALGRFGLSAAAVEPLRLGKGFTQVLHVVSGTGEGYALKLYSPPPSGAAGELRTAALLRSPEVLASQLGWLSDLGRQPGLLVP